MSNLRPQLRVYHFINTRYGFDSILNRRIKVSRVSSLNDPFEYFQYQTDNHFARFLLRERRSAMNKLWGLLCFSGSYANPVQWAHYADCHRGMCLGFDVPSDRLLKIEYVKQRASFEEFQEALKLREEEFLMHMLSKKYEHWAYEEEYRLLHRFKKKTKGGELCFTDFSEDLELREVLLGARFDGDRKVLRAMLKDFDPLVRTFTVSASSGEFRMVRAGQ